MNSGSQLSRMLYQNHLVPVLSLAGCYHLMQVRWVDQTQYPMIVVASLSAVPQSCRTPLLNQYLDCMLLAVYTHTQKLLHRDAFTHREACTHSKLLHAKSFTHSKLLQKKVFTQRSVLVHNHNRNCSSKAGSRRQSRKKTILKYFLK